MPISSRLLFVACVLAVVPACGIADFDVSQDIPSQTIQGSSLPAPIAALFPIPVSLDLQSAIAAHDTGPIDSVTLSSLELTITSTGGKEDWSFVTSIEVSVSSSASGSTLPTVQIASATSPGAVSVLKFDVDGDVNLKPYINDGSTVSGQGSGDAPANDITYDGKAVFTVHPL